MRSGTQRDPWPLVEELTTLTTVAGPTQVRLVLTGGLGGASFDNVWMGEI